MFRDIPECSMFHVPGFIDGQWKTLSIQYSSFDWINEQYAYTIFGMLSTRTSPVVAGMISKMADIEASFMEGAEKVGLRQDT